MRNSEERLNKLLEQFPKNSYYSSSKNEEEKLNIFVEFAIMEFCIHHEDYESLMDEKTGMSFHQYIL